MNIAYMDACMHGACMLLVERLNNLLSQYQSKDEPPSSQDEQTVPPSLQSPHATWLTDKRYTLTHAPLSKHTHTHTHTYPLLLATDYYLLY